MKRRQQQRAWGWGSGRLRTSEGGPIAARLLDVADGGLFATICIAPFVFGGRHDLGRLVFVSLVALTAAAWFLRQCLLPKAHWTRTWAHCVLLLTVGLVVLQMAPLPAAWIARLVPRTAELLPLWAPGASGTQLGTWNTLSLTPHDSALALAMVVSYGLLFVVVSQRAATTGDIVRLLNWIGIAAAAMAGFGILQYFASNGRFFWCYEHPFRTTDEVVNGAFMNRNHFADFLVLGLAPLVRWLVEALRAQASNAQRRRLAGQKFNVEVAALIAAITVVALAILLSLSRGGIMALVASAVVMGTIYWRWRLVDARYAFGLAGVTLVALGLLSISGYEKLARRMDDFTEGSLEAVDHGEGRRRIWAANVEAFEHGWLAGAGAGSHSEICPVYLSEPSSQEYTHAENGYLQIATEMGIGGIGLLGAGIGLCGFWCMGALRRLTTEAEQLCLGATAAGLAASVVHSFVDFVWYIPACMSVTLVLAACTLRLAQLSLPEDRRAAMRPRWRRPRSLEMAALVIPAGAWTVFMYFAPAMASIHWDRYLRDSVANSQLQQQQFNVAAANQNAFEPAMLDPLADSMIEHLEQVVAWDPSFARAHLRLAGRYVDRFELSQQRAANAMTLAQIREAIQSSKFSSAEEQQAWLKRAFGANVECLHRAYYHAQQAVALCPLQGEAYLYLAELCFLEGAPQATVDEYVAQGVRVRPCDSDMTFEVGKEVLLSGDVETAFTKWKDCFQNAGLHRLRIVQLLAGRVPAAMFVEHFKPDWTTLREVWVRYRQAGQPQDMADLVAYAATVTQRATQEESDIPPAYILLWQGMIYADVQRPSDALACYEQAYRTDPAVFAVRYALGQALMDAGRFAEAEPHVRWCLARRPENKGLNAALVDIAKQRIVQRELVEGKVDNSVRPWAR